MYDVYKSKKGSLSGASVLDDLPHAEVLVLVSYQCGSMSFVHRSERRSAIVHAPDLKTGCQHFPQLQVAGMYSKSP
jgi:hypothetical protein